MIARTRTPRAWPPQRAAGGQHPGSAPAAHRRGSTSPMVQFGRRMIARNRARRELHPKPALPRVEPLRRLLDARVQHGDKFDHARIVHQAGCRGSPLAIADERPIGGAVQRRSPVVREYQGPVFS
jgi:hypothetical protein